MFTTLEQELTARIFLHKVAVTRGALVNEYIAKEKQADVVLPDMFLEENAMQQVDSEIQQALQNGTFNEMYEQAWERITPHMPEHFSIM